jgi:hypothetical protein
MFSVARIFIAVLPVMLFCALTPGSGLFAGDKRPLEGVVTGGLDSGEYLVKSVLTVPVGDTLSVGAGAVLYFEQLTGIDVRGVLVVGGEVGAPVVMTSSNDTAGAVEAAQAFDWNGVRAFGREAAVFMRHAVIGNSVYGVNMGDTLSRLELLDVIFRDNGYAPLVRGAEIVPVPADTAVSLAWNMDAPQKAGKRVRAARVGGGGGRVKFIVNVSALGVAAVGMTVCYVGLSNTSVYNEHYVSDGGSAGRFAGYYEDKIRKNIAVSAVGAVAAGVGLGCVGVTLFF